MYLNNVSEGGGREITLGAGPVARYLVRVFIRMASLLRHVVSYSGRSSYPLPYLVVIYGYSMMVL